jgi:hypothetical protein
MGRPGWGEARAIRSGHSGIWECREQPQSAPAHNYKACLRSRPLHGLAQGVLAVLFGARV